MKVSQKGIFSKGACRIAAALAALACAASVCATGLPAEYSRVGSIQSAGRSGSDAPYIDLGYMPTSNTWVDIDFEVMAYGTGAYDMYPCPIGTCHANNALAFTLTGGATQTAGHCWSFRWGGGGNAVVIAGSTIVGRHTLEAHGATWTIDGLTAAKSSWGSSTTALDTSLYVFARNNNGTMDHPVYMNLYGLDIYEGGVLQHSFVPCIRNFDKEPGLYDIVGDKGFLVNSGTGAFTFTTLEIESAASVLTYCPQLCVFTYCPQPVVHSVTNRSVALVEDVDYTLTYGMDTGAGYTNMYVTATGIGAYAGESADPYWFEYVWQATDTFSVGQIAPVAYKDGQPCTPRPVVRTADESRKLVEGTDYDLSWDSNCEIGRGYAVINGKGDFEGKIWIAPFSILPVLPSGYKAAEYIRGFGKQYIDTGFKPDTNTRADMRFDVESAPKIWESVFGSRQSASAKKFYIVYNYTGKKWSCNIAATAAWEPSAPAALGGHYFSIDKTTFTLDGVSQTLSATPFDKTYNAYVFSINNNGSPLNISQANLKMKLYSLKIWDDGTLVREFVPCVNKDGEAGLYDVTPGAEKKFYSNDGTGTFEAGPVLDVARTGFAVYVH